MKRLTAAQAKAHLRQAQQHINAVLADPYIIEDFNETMTDIYNELQLQINVLEAHWREPNEE